MHLILTHEQADFDAIASLLGARLMDERAWPVLPRRMNRNIRSFLALYGADLPFLDPRDLPQETIESITLVDTQSLTTLKGMGERTTIRVIDHHSRREGTSREWNFTHVDCGATTTYFVEKIQSNSATLTVLQATLLLMGIYEDTGSLTYSRTTARDAHAVAFLLEMGADLRLAARFLNPPLTPDQRTAYDRLVASAETHDIHGQRVIIATGKVTEFNEEISTLAHKLRDLLDPDALFVLVETVEGVRLVARSTTDQIDVAVIAAHFGGGGHDRAAAALIRPNPAQPGRDAASLLETTRAALIELLPGHVRAPLTVAQLMSRRPRVIAADTPVQEAARLMQKYGYEGFPVAHEGRVVGLLTRRAVDRAISHRLNLTAASLMEAGEVQVHPSDSVQQLQTVMTDSGWGQIPVVEPQSQKIIGIVTRTDLLKTLAPRPRHAARRNYAEKLEKSLPVERLALIRTVAAQAAALHMPVYVVGGFVRDLLLGHPGLDFDIVVEGDAITLARSLQQKFGGHVASHSRFGTAKWHPEPADSAPLDLISARQEFYEHPSALPTVEHGSIQRDLHRRDFTINTLALRLDGRHFGEIHDYFSGQADLHRRLVRVLHSLSFVDDPTRMLRAVRYEQRYGFRIEPRTLQLMDEARPLLARLSDERTRHELDLIFDEPKAVAMLARLHELGLLKAISEHLPWDDALRLRLDTALGQIPAPEWDLGRPVNGVPFREALGYAVWLSGLGLDAIDALQARLRFPHAVLKAVRAAARLRGDLESLRGSNPSGWAMRLEDVPQLAVYAVSLHHDEPALTLYGTHWRTIHPRANGDTLKALGLVPGPAYQTILWQLRAAWLDGLITTDAQEEALLRRLIAEA